MRCPLGRDESGELVVGYAAGTLDARAQADFEHHLKFCEACAEAASAQHAVWDALDELMPACLLTRHRAGFPRVRVLQCRTSGRLRACCWRAVQ
jgi:Putative zinc-finger